MSKKKIIEHIGIGTAQSLGVYIKKKFPKEETISKVQRNVQIEEQKANNSNNGFSLNFQNNLMNPTSKNRKKHGKYQLKK